MNDFPSGPASAPLNDPAHSHGDAVVPPRKPRRTGRLAVILVVVLSLLGIGAGVVVFMDQRAEAIAAEQKAAAKQRAEARERREARAEVAVEKAAYETCVDEMSPILEDLSTLDARLDVGLDLDEYSDLLGAASVSYDAMDIDAPEPDCISDVGVPLENALNKYIEIASTWNDCIWEDTYCSMDNIDAEMQLAWLKSSQLIDKASESLDDLDPSNAGQI
jgi:hypothetical protein